MPIWIWLQAIFDSPHVLSCLPPMKCLFLGHCKDTSFCCPALIPFFQMQLPSFCVEIQTSPTLRACSLVGLPTFMIGLMMQAWAGQLVPPQPQGRFQSWAHDSTTDFCRACWARRGWLWEHEGLKVIFFFPIKEGFRTVQQSCHQEGRAWRN